jgi:hypothetical protein
MPEPMLPETTETQPIDLLHPKLGVRDALNHAVIVLAPTITVVLLLLYLARHELAVDFQRTYWLAGLQVLHGEDPYRASAQQISGGAAFVYPALAGILFAPFALVSHAVSTAIFIAVTMGAVIGTLLVARVRDWRLYPLAFLWWPVINGWQTANVTLLLGFLIILVWRYRDSTLRAGLLVALAISIKPFVWPIGLWLLATRRYRAAGWAFAWGLVINALAWWVLGFDEISRYLRISSDVTSALERTGYGVIALCLRAGAAVSLASAVMYLLAALVALLCVWIGRRGREEAALTVAVTLMLVASPLVWNHYFALLIVPLAILRPRVDALWLVPLVLWLCPATHVAEWQALIAALVTAWATYQLVRDPAAPPLAVAPLRQRRPDQAHILATTQGGERAG